MSLRNRLLYQFGAFVVSLLLWLGALLLFTACSPSLLEGPAGPYPEAPQHLPDSTSAAPRASSTADSAATGSEAPSPATAALPEPPAPPAADATPGQVRRYVRAMKAYAVGVAAHHQPVPKKLKGGSVYAAPGSDVTAATGKGAAAAAPSGLAVAARGADAVTPVLGNGNHVKQPAPKVKRPFFSLALSSWSWLLLVLVAVAVFWIRHLNRS